ncbi:MAG TPA: aldo/keto reductase [Steroidobacteraceae bacterium]|nr:aldo/keto reductase [Steroidobacteraceae bacterium]
MQLHTLGGTGVKLPALGFGCMGLVGWYGGRDDAEAEATVAEAIERGVAHFDTAATYQQGDNERFVGPRLKARRDRVFLATKCGLSRSPDGSVRVDNQPATIVASCDASLERLGIVHIDLFYLHRIDKSVPIEESVGALGRLVTAGKIRHIGLSECSADTLRRACKVHPVAAVQSEYSLWTRDPEASVLPACRELKVSLVAYSPLGRGFLAGNFRSLQDLPADDVRQHQPRFQGANGEHNLRVAGAIQELAAKKGCTAAQLAIAWVLAQGEDILPIPGMKTRAHLNDNLGALDVRLSGAELAGLRALLDLTPVKGDRYPPAMLQALDR